MSKKKQEPGRAPWMSDAGYASYLRAASLSPSIARLAVCSLQLKCPHCEHLSKIIFEAETSPSSGYTTEHDCEACGREFVIDAVLDVQVKVE